MTLKCHEMNSFAKGASHVFRLNSSMATLANGNDDSAVVNAPS